MHGLTSIYSTFMKRAKNTLGIDKDDQMEQKAQEISERYQKIIKRNIYEMTEDDSVEVLSRGSNVRPFSTPNMVPIILTPALKNVSEEEGSGIKSHEVLIYMSVTDENMENIVMMPLNAIGAIDLAKRLMTAACSVEELYNKHMDEDGNVDMIALSGEDLDACMDHTDHHFVNVIRNNETQNTHLLFCCKEGLQSAVDTIQEVIDDSE